MLNAQQDLGQEGCRWSGAGGGATVQRPPDIKATTEEIRDYALKSVLDLKSLLRTVTQKTKVKLAQHVKELVLTPGNRDGEDVYEVSGEWELLPEKKCVILYGGQGRNRTADASLFRAALYQLSYLATERERLVMGAAAFEL